MNSKQLIFRSLVYYWRTNVAVVLGVATAVAVLSGALLVGGSVRASLRALILDRIGRTDDVVASPRFYSEALATAVQRDPDFARTFQNIAPLIVARGIVTSQDSGRRAGDVIVYGVDDRFWRLHGVSVSGPQGRDAFVSRALASQLRASAGAALLVRLQRVSDVPIESLHGRKEDVGRSVRVDVKTILSRESLGEFSLEPGQGDVRAVFLPLSRLQTELGADERVNTMLLTRNKDARDAVPALQGLLRRHATLADAGLTVTTADPAHAVVVGSTGGVLDDREQTAAAQALERLGLQPQRVFTYLANGLRIGDRDLPYSLVSALDLRTVSPRLSDVPNPIVLNEWAATDLHATLGDSLTLDYYAWEEPGRLVTRSAAFTVAAVVPISAGGRDLSPTFPGITDSPTLDDWDPPFPVDLRRVRKQDEAYWEQYRTTPKAFIPLEIGQRLWGTRYGTATSVRATVRHEKSLSSPAERLRASLQEQLDPLGGSIVVRDVRASGLEASRGATDFGEYFVYFSFFLVVSALLLVSLFFKLGVEQRLRDVGLLRAVGLGPAAVRRLFLGEGAILATAGSVIGAAAGVGYAALLMYALRTWWVDAVGTTSLTLHVDGVSLAIGIVSGLVASLACIGSTLRSLAAVTERTLLTGERVSQASSPAARARRLLITGVLFASVGVVLVGAGALHLIDQVGAFFGAGVALMGAALALFLWMLRRQPRTAAAGVGWRAVSHLGVRYASYRAGRSVLSAAVIASATFILIAVGAFRQDGAARDRDRHSGVGGYALVVDTLLPIVHDPNSPEGREALNLFNLDPGVRLESFRVLPGDDASCLNLYRPANPRIMAPQDSFLDEGRFVFTDSLASSDAERANPWLLLRRREPDGAVPVIADANSMTYVLHKSLGDVIVLSRGGTEVRLRLVAALRDSIFQGELLMSRANFITLFPDIEGYQRLLVETPGARVEPAAEVIGNALADSGADVQTTWDRLAQFHRVENTYLSTFQTLGGLGLLLGTVGLGAVLLRNALERRRELALLGAVGFRRAHFLAMLMAENALLLGAGVSTGALAAVLAIAPAAAARGGRVPVDAGVALLLVAVLVTGLLSSIVAIRAATRGSLLSSLRSE